MTIEQAKYFAKKGYLTPYEKDIIKAECRKYRVRIPKCSCTNKWNDTAVLLYSAMRKAEKRAAEVNSAYVFKGEKPMMVKGVEFSPTTDTDDIVWLKETYPSLFRALYNEKESES